jgi:hypothetical protein
MATRKSRRASTAKSTQSKSSARKSESAFGAKSPPKEVAIQFEHAADYRQIFSTGSLIRVEKNSIVVTFYTDELSPVCQTATLASTKGDSATYNVGDLQEVPRRLVTASIRVDPEHAASLATLIAEKCYSIRPDLFPQTALPPQSDSEKK